MKILYFGTVCDLDAYNKRLEKWSQKLSVAPIVFESALLNGFFQNSADVEIHSFPMVPVFPFCKEIFFGGKTEHLSCGYSCRWLRTINIPVLKQISRNIDAKIRIKRWLKQNADDGIIFTYSIPPFLVKSVLRYAKRFKVKTVAIIPDLLRDMYINQNKSSPITSLKRRYLSPSLSLQGEYDGYIYLTDEMSKVVAPDKPYIVMEGIADVSAVTLPVASEKSTPRGIMYAGMLHKKYGIVNLLDAFEKINADAELWLFGDGTAVPEIIERSKKDSRIRYFGSVSHDEILDFERKATILINPRNPDDEFTKYSFPSKTIEYMLSGTPLVSTKLKGIPEEYSDYVFWAESGDSDDLAEIVNKVLSCDAQGLNDFGKRAQDFIVKEKNSCSQSARILDFLKEVKYDSEI